MCVRGCEMGLGVARGMTDGRMDDGRVGRLCVELREEKWGILSS